MTGPQVIGVGMMTIDDLCLVDELPAFGTSRRARARSRQCGGPAATAMAALSRLGIATRMLAKIGDDNHGDFLYHGLASFGVDVSCIQRGHGASRVASVFVDAATGERGFLSTPEGFEPLSSRDLDPATFSGAQIVHIDDADEAGLAAAKLADAAGQRVVFDGTWQSDHLAEFLPHVEAAIISEFFSQRWLPGVGEEEVLRRLLDLGAQTAVLTRGDRGSIAAAGSGPVTSCPAFCIDVVDTTGAGDAFHAGFIYSMLQLWPLPRTLRFASAMGALNCRQLGGQSGLPPLAQVVAFLDARE
ncbi:MAG: hypothetical protein HN712_18300 [Gemmatimonadetes bacterium]|nr:hypothetical protein [Gemmatimonadota bacterium]MBT6144273.1 hypothetical protein [Gemmatimonadota bacterium]MBT7862276.1 hypothetical protein [Gemmatimonadota bacterium]